jgi:UPF0716 protein FxsA
MVDAAMIFAAGALLVTPGILTDLFGLTLLIPPCRAFYRKRLISWFQTHFTVQSFSPGSGGRFGGRSEVIDSHVVPRDPEP